MAAHKTHHLGTMGISHALEQHTANPHRRKQLRKQHQQKRLAPHTHGTRQSAQFAGMGLGNCRAIQAWQLAMDWRGTSLSPFDSAGSRTSILQATAAYRTKPLAHFVGTSVPLEAFAMAR
jgi:hypothetical protein